jgi:hypothetical protein
VTAVSLSAWPSSRAHIFLSIVGGASKRLFVDLGFSTIVNMSNIDLIIDIRQAALY